MTNTRPGDANSAAATAPDHDFWRKALRVGGFTALPRWTLDPAPGFGEREAAIPDELAAALRRLAQEMTVPLSSVFLAACIKVLGALSGEHEVTLGYAATARPPLPLRVTIPAGTWRDVLLAGAHAESELLSHGDFPLDSLRREPGFAEPLFEAVFEPVADVGAQWTEGTVLRVSFMRDEHFAIRLRYRTDALDDTCASRIAGYHLSALAGMAADPDAKHENRSLLSADELRLQLHGLAGPQRTLPNLRVHQLFEEGVRAHPDAIAAVRGSERQTYRELNARANRLARVLSARGLSREGVVGVMTERTLGWLSAVLAIFKAGGAYLPIEPGFPPDRVAKMLSRAGCRLVLTEHGGAAMLERVIDELGEIQHISIDAALAEDAPDEDPGIEVTPDQLAYIYFTSGSTGEPKGAMCEHGGMLNHLFAKIDDLGIGKGTVVAQIAPQCFDISLWQLVSALLVGGTTRLIEQETVLDARRFVDAIVDGKVNVLQVVPSYLEVVLTYLERHPRRMPDLRYVAVTGEALKKELAQRWFAAQPGIKLVNAYGLTETSDDTNHEVMDSAPSRERVPLGRPVNNVHVYVVDDGLSPVPLGAPGEIVFSGVCVGRGYINDPERTRRAFMPDPHRDGSRLYRSGDVGRWLPDGKLEFLGRRDSQVKLSGFRIELGEIENKLLQLPGVRDCAVVVAERDDAGKRLVAFYSSDQSIDANLLEERLRESLPGYMIPSAIHWSRSLPLTDNGKIDRKALRRMADRSDVSVQDRERTRTQTEQRLAAAWAEVLGVPSEQIGRDAHFFDLGGTSLSALHLVIRLGRTLSLKDLTAHPMLADLARFVDERSMQQLPQADPARSPMQPRER
ncbi:non-ribosomal peptide synthetase [Burkholderia ubonensis]|uniref:non-ribosomal peptide synthetase n=1 Tax=Burkholderia ubonensis TaxID=101571 RepID=UPI00075F3707|nr:amino acid adenylation domain-containing protein [Burkholderia ubonensis]KVZ04300.1 non-ribosomal peptide synthetase [Burkholderia ubonensis]